MRNIKDISISSCLPLFWYKDWYKIDINKLVYVGKKRVRHKCGRKMYYYDEYVYWYPENIYGTSVKPVNEGEYFRSTKLLGD